MIVLLSVFVAVPSVAIWGDSVSEHCYDFLKSLKHFWFGGFDGLKEVHFKSQPRPIFSVDSLSIGIFGRLSPVLSTEAWDGRCSSWPRLPTQLGNQFWQRRESTLDSFLDCIKWKLEKSLLCLGSAALQLLFPSLALKKLMFCQLSLFMSTGIRPRHPCAGAVCSLDTAESHYCLSMNALSLNMPSFPKHSTFPNRERARDSAPTQNSFSFSRLDDLAELCFPPCCVFHLPLVP